MIASPAAMPSEPPMKAKSCTAMTIGSRRACRAGEDRILGAGLLLGLLEAVGIAALVAELERIERPGGSAMV